MGTKKRKEKPIIIVACALLIFTTILFAKGKFTKEVIFKGCGTRLPNHEYSIKFPFFWSVKQTSSDIASNYYEARGLNSTLTVSCTNQGVGGDVCEDNDRTEFMIAGVSYQACYGFVDGKWKMGVLNLSTGPATNATLSFWSDGLEKKQIETILSSLKVFDK